AMRNARLCALILAAGPLLAQHEYTQTDADIGARLYIANCIYCHGPDGDQIPGINLGHGKFKHATTDNDIVQIIRNGIPGTGMPAQTMPEPQVRTIVAYLRSLAAAPASDLPPGGDAARGQAIFQGKGQCLNCHRVKDAGSRLGPDLTDIGSLRRVVELEKSLLDPNASVLPQHRFFRVVARDGASVTGRILNQDTFTVQLIDTDQRLRSFSRADLREFTPLNNSPMPSYKGKLSTQELADLVSYLVSLKGI
ncbi:MAG TPA: c-type cytochrome, partial [Bryobacteraceae bacterium]|nr:c-type cytochrome [Bryobacteraceae bacterium]